MRGFTNWGISALPKPLRNKSGSSLASSASSPPSPYNPQLSNKHTVGHYFIMRFDSSARTQHTLRKTWASDPRLLRFSVVKMGEKLGEIAEVGGKAEEWEHVLGSEGTTGVTFREQEEGAVSGALRELGARKATTMGSGRYRFPS